MVVTSLSFSPTETLPLRVDAHGVVRMANSRIPIDNVITAYQRGATPEEIVEEQYPTLNVADVYLVIGFYLRHKPEVDVYLAEQAAEEEKILRIIDERSNHAQFREELLARWNKRQQEKSNDATAG